MIKGYLGKIKVGDNFPTPIVGVVNLSPASFYQGSIASTNQDLEEIVLKMINEGVNCLDIGAQSTRPIQIYGGAGRVDEIQEKEIIDKSLEVVLDIIKSYENIEISIDTTRSSVAESALKKDIRIINDISGFKKDEKMANLIADYDACAIVMAAKNEPGDIYTIDDVLHELRLSINIGLNNGIKEDRIIIDPGIGSWEARDYYHDYSLIRNLEEFRVLNKPIYIGISRKTSIGKALNDAPPEDRLYGSIGATIVAILNGAHIVRTHDVKPTLEAIRVVETILNFDKNFSKNFSK
ncbi:MAG: dihydropteroate synthase [Candidatus Thorarchaeota archaeon]